MLQRSWVGRRVSVRRVLDRDPDGRLALGDVVGDLVGLDDQTAVVETRNGLVEVPLPLITVARLVPASTADELALDEIGARALQPAQTEELDGWRLRADHGYTDRANSVLPLRQLRMPLDEALGRAHDWYAERGLPVRIHVSVEARRLLDAGLGERGWHPGPDVHVMTARLDQLRRAPEPDGRVQVHDAPDDDWLALYRGGSGLTQTGRALLARHDRAGFATLRLDGRAVAVGRATVDDEWLGVMAVEVDPAYRRQGLAGAVMAALTGWGAAHGARRSYLQVYADNRAAVALYEDLGYWVHHDYRYRTEP